jgi:hypothetical protein
MSFKTMPKVAACQENVIFNEKKKKNERGVSFRTKRVLDAFWLTLLDAKSPSYDPGRKISFSTSGSSKSHLK